MVEVATIVLAGGRATRFGTGPNDSKVFALLDGMPLVAHVAATALRSRTSHVLVVVGQAASRAVQIFGEQPAVTLVRNHDYASGMATSIKAGIAALPDTSDGALILLADMPLVSHATLDRLITLFEGRRPDAVVPRYAGCWGNPVLIGRPLFPQMLALSGDRGARGVLEEPGHDVITCDVDDPHVLTDIDTPDALDRIAGSIRDRRE